MLRDSGSNNNPIANSTPSVQVLVSKCHCSMERTRLLVEVADSRARSNVPNELGTPSSIRKNGSDQGIKKYTLITE